MYSIAMELIAQFDLEAFLLSDPVDLATNKSIPRPHQVFGHERELVDTYSYGHIKLVPGIQYLSVPMAFGIIPNECSSTKSLGNDF